MDALLNIALNIAAGAFIAFGFYGCVEWALAKRNERKLTKHGYEAAQAQRTFWEKAHKEAEITITHKETK